MHRQACLNSYNSLLLPTVHHSPFQAIRPCRHPGPSRQPLCKPPRGLLDSLFGKQSSSDLHPDGPLFAPIDTASEGGLGGTSDSLFGPLVPYSAMALPRLSWQGAHMQDLEALCFAQAVLLIGFSQYEVDAFRAFMIDMDADMVKVNSILYLSRAFPREKLLPSPVDSSSA